MCAVLCMTWSDICCDSGQTHIHLQPIVQGYAVIDGFLETELAQKYRTEILRLFKVTSRSLLLAAFAFPCSAIHFHACLLACSNAGWAHAQEFYTPGGWRSKKVLGVFPICASGPLCLCTVSFFLNSAFFLHKTH